MSKFSPLPYKLNKTTKKTTVSDGMGNSIEVPQYGCLSLNEMEAIRDIPEKTKNYDQVYVARLLQQRFKKEYPEILELTEKEVLSPDGEPFPQSLLNSLYAFFLNEQRQWQPMDDLVYVRGERAKEIAIAEAERLKAVAAVRSDEKAQNVYHVYQTRGKFDSDNQTTASLKSTYEALMVNPQTSSEDLETYVQAYKELFTWEVVADFTETVEEQPVGKPIGQLSIGSSD